MEIKQAFFEQMTTYSTVCCFVSDLVDKQEKRHHVENVCFTGLFMLSVIVSFLLNDYVPVVFMGNMIAVALFLSRTEKTMINLSVSNKLMNNLIVSMSHDWLSIEHHKLNDNIILVASVMRRDEYAVATEPIKKILIENEELLGKLRETNKDGIQSAFNKLVENSKNELKNL